jgi:hypothetical protein
MTRALPVIALCIFGGCASSSDRAGFSPSADGGATQSSPNEPSGDQGPGFDKGDAGKNPNPPECTTATQFVYVISDENTLYRFDPANLKFTSVGTLDCKNSETPHSMAVDRNGVAWVVYTEGSLYHVSTTDASCTPTSYERRQSNITSFGMGFSSNSAGSTDEQLFITKSDVGEKEHTFGTIDTKSLTLSTIGDFDKLDARAEFTGTGDGRLFGAFEGTPFVVAEIDKSTAKILSQAPQKEIQYPLKESHFAFAAWGGDFWIFAGPKGSTDVFQYRPSTGVTKKVATQATQIVGAGVSTCAPTKPVN